MVFFQRGLPALVPFLRRGMYCPDRLRLWSGRSYSHFKTDMPIPRDLPSQPRKLPRQARSISTVDAILEAAARLLEQQKFHAFSTNAIAALAGVSTGSLYQYYPDKEAVLRALIIREMQGRVDHAVEAMRQHTGPGAVMAGVAAALAHAQGRPALTTQLAFAEPMILAAPHDSALTTGLFIALEQAIQRDHGVSAQLATDLAHDVLGICKGMLLSAAARNSVSSADLAKKISVAVGSYLDAITKS